MKWLAMSELTVEQLDKALAGREPFYLIRILKAEGSTPRDAGAMMIVGRDKIHGTIGGGSAEWVAIKAARSFIDGEEFVDHQLITLGPEIDNVAVALWKSVTSWLMKNCARNLNN